MAPPKRSYDTKPISPAQEFARLVASVSYAERLKTVRAYYSGFENRHGFNLRNVEKLSPAKKKKITQYYKAIRPFLSVPIVKQKARNTAEASAAWRWLHGVEPPLGTLYIPVHEAPENKPRIKFEKIYCPPGAVPGECPPVKKVPLKEKIDTLAKKRKRFKKPKKKRVTPAEREYIEEQYEEYLDDEGLSDYSVRVTVGQGIQVSNHFFEDYGLSPDILATDPDAALAHMLDQIGATSYSIVCGNNLFNNYAKRRRGTKDELRDNTFWSGTKDDVIKMIKRLQGEYNDKSKNNYWGNWLQGVKGYYFNNQSVENFTKYRKKVTKARLERITMWRKVRSLNRSINNAHETIDIYTKELKYLSRNQPNHYNEDGRLLTWREVSRRKKHLRRFIPRTERRLAEAMKERAEIIDKLTSKL